MGTRGSGGHAGRCQLLTAHLPSGWGGCTHDLGVDPIQRVGATHRRDIASTAALQ
jgi:hypothetical protein